MFDDLDELMLLHEKGESIQDYMKNTHVSNVIDILIVCIYLMVGQRLVNLKRI